MNNWISIKDRLPENGIPVVVRLNYKNETYTVARFYDNLSTIFGDFTRVWIVCLWPRFPKGWFFTSPYGKPFKFEKNLVTHWMPLPDKPEDVE